MSTICIPLLAILQFEKGVGRRYHTVEQNQGNRKVQNDDQPTLSYANGTRGFF